MREKISANIAIYISAVKNNKASYRVVEFCFLFPFGVKIFILFMMHLWGKV